MDGASKTLIGVLVDQSDLDNTRFLVAVSLWHGISVGK